jgi:pullulanase
MSLHVLCVRICNGKVTRNHSPQTKLLTQINSLLNRRFVRSKGLCKYKVNMPDFFAHQYPSPLLGYENLAPLQSESGPGQLSRCRTICQVTAAVSSFSQSSVVLKNPTPILQTTVLCFAKPQMASPLVFDLLERRKCKFVLWIPNHSADSAAPELILGPFNPDNPKAVDITFQGPLQKSGQPDLFELDPNSIQPALQDGQIYHYWFQVTDTSSENLGQIRVTDPWVYTVDYRTVTNRKAEDSKVQPAGVIKFRGGRLWPCDIDGCEPTPVAIPNQTQLPDNNQMVIYELPTSCARPSEAGDVETDTGTFTDVLALFDVATAGDCFKCIPGIANEAIVSDLGINALELLPPADAKPIDQWGYATAQYYAPDFDLGTASQLKRLVEHIHAKNIRFFIDVVMAFGHDPYVNIAYKSFHIDPSQEPDNEDSQECNGEGLRNGYGGSSWRYIKNMTTYDPNSGTTSTLTPSWAFHQGHLHRWMSDFGVGGLRLDSVNNVANYDFLKAYKDYAWELYHSRYASPADSKFIVIGEELSDPLSMITTGTLNGLWNESFKRRLRGVILGNAAEGDGFEWTVRKMVDCTLDNSHPFTDLAQAVIYITSHDVGGFGNERLYNFLQNNSITDTSEIQRRAKLAFACLLTAVGIPMIFAGEEFADIQDNFLDPDFKQTDPVNYARKTDPWRMELFNYVANLVKFRKECPALGENDTNFIHVDQNGQIMAWTRGTSNQAPVVVVANFSSNDTPGDEYVVQNWPNKGQSGWREITQNRNVPDNWVGREPLMRNEVKIYWTGAL